MRPAVRLEPQADGLAHLVLEHPQSPVNAIDLLFLEDLEEALDEALAAVGQQEMRGLILWSPRPGQFVAGADLKLLSRLERPEEAEGAARRLQGLLARLEAVPVPTVAAIGGPALGGGLELALACDWRVAARSREVRLGLPEVQLGLIPASGGTQRLPRLIGLPGALALILSGRRLSAERARRQGLVDLLVHPAALRRGAVALARRGKRRAAPPGPLQQGILRLPLARLVLLEQARRRVERETRGHYPAPLVALRCLRVGLERGMAAGLEVEAQAFGQLAAGRRSRNLVRLFLAGQELRHPPAGARPLKHLGVVGGGLMGSGIAEVAAASGLTVRLRDVDHAAVARGLAAVQRLVGEGVAKGAFEPRQGRRILRRVSGTVDYTGFAHAELVIEAVYEDLDLKRRVLSELEEVVGGEAILASNTSALPIAQLAREARAPERILGMHFFSPAHRMPLVEIVRWKGSADRAVQTAVAAALRLGKTPIVVADGPGFYTTRTLGAMVAEAGQLLTEGARIEEVDEAMVRFGFPMGPFALLDELGLEVAAHVARFLQSALPGRLAEAGAIFPLVEDGRRGRRSRRGFYRYDGRRQPDAEVYALLGVEPRGLPGAVVRQRLSLAFVNEAARCLEEGILASPRDGDVGAVLGVGFPPFLGGPFRYAQEEGMGSMAGRLEELAAEHGPRFAPSGALLSGEPFYP